jgi:hypothetical protein
MNAYLKAHPDVFMCEPKDVHYFGSDLDLSHRLTPERYLSCFAGADGSKRIGESSVWYMYSKKAAEEIKEFSPSASIMIMLRNPVDMLYSLHSHLVFSHDEDLLDLRTAMDAEEDRKAGRRLPSKSTCPRRNFDRKYLYYREVVKYAEQVQRYFDVFSREKVHVVVYDDFRRDLPAVYRKTLQFLGVDEGFQPPFPVINVRRSFRSRALSAFLRDPPEVIRRTAGALIPGSIARRLRVAVQRLNTRHGVRPPMDPELRKRLQAEFLPEVERLSALLGRDLTSWCRSGEGRMGQAA